MWFNVRVENSDFALSGIIDGDLRWVGRFYGRFVLSRRRSLVVSYEKKLGYDGGQPDNAYGWDSLLCFLTNVHTCFSHISSFLFSRSIVRRFSLKILQFLLLTSLIPTDEEIHLESTKRPSLMSA